MPRASALTPALCATLERGRAAWAALSGSGLLIPLGILSLYFGGRMIQRLLGRAANEAHANGERLVSHPLENQSEGREVESQGETSPAGQRLESETDSDDSEEWEAWAQALDGDASDGTLVLRCERSQAARAPFGAKTPRSEERDPIVHRLEFPADAEWSVRGGHDLVAGNLAQVTYDLRRIPAVYGDNGARRGPALRGHYRFNDEAPKEFVLTRRSGEGPSATSAHGDFDLARSGLLSLWFAALAEDGRPVWDSRFGENYRVIVRGESR